MERIPVDVTKTILNVDDHAPARFVRTRILQKAGYGVDEADNAAVAIELASQAALVLLDVRLPDADGFTVCEQMKKVAPALPVVMVTSVYRTAQARRDAFAVGADAFLLEPMAPEQLVRTVEGLLNRPADTRPARRRGVDPDRRDREHRRSQRRSDEAPEPVGAWGARPQPARRFSWTTGRS